MKLITLLTVLMISAACSSTKPSQSKNSHTGEMWASNHVDKIYKY